MENNGFILFVGSAFICLSLIALPVFLLALAVALGLAIVRYRKEYIMDHYYVCQGIIDPLTSTLQFVEY
jgi:hypothetical protein